jgi:hypothetical protein
MDWISIVKMNRNRDGDGFQICRQDAVPLPEGVPVIRIRPGSALLEKDSLAQTIDLRNAAETPAERAEDTETAGQGK